MVEKKLLNGRIQFVAIAPLIILGAPGAKLQVPGESVEEAIAALEKALNAEKASKEAA